MIYDQKKSREFRDISMPKRSLTKKEDCQKLV